jgi:hypothetical protein
MTLNVNFKKPSYSQNIAIYGNVASAVFSGFKGGLVKDTKTADNNGDAVIAFVRLDEFVVMPNHVHGIIVIDKQNNEPTNEQTVETQNFASLQHPLFAVLKRP